MMAGQTLNSTLRRLAGMIALLLLAGLACNAPLEPLEPEPPAGEDSTEPDGESSEDPASPTDEEGAPGATPEPSATATPPPTETPDATPTLTATPEPSPTAGATPTEPKPTATNTRAPLPTATKTPGSSGPLDFDYSINWVLKPGDPQTAIATVSINATGGSGEYRYFRDGIEVDGPLFSYEWASCRGNPGSLRVDSSDGQSKTIEYFSAPPCPTPTPTP